MTYSMTGFGKHSTTCKGRIITVEIRALNSKQFDLNLRLPAAYREMEFEVRDLLSATLNRGKVDVSIQRDLAPGEVGSTVNAEMATAYYRWLKDFEKTMDEPAGAHSSDYLQLILRMPDVLKPVTEAFDEDEFNAVREALKVCIDNTIGYRSQEGEKTAKVLEASVRSIMAGLESVGSLESERVARIRSRVEGGLAELGDAVSIDKDRLEQEMIYYIERLDISEEKMRLQAHCDYFLKTLREEHFKGKKLNFISQEMGREINTLGSKAQHSEIQRLVVEMKDELEQIKEQILNVL